MSDDDLLATFEAAGVTDATDTHVARTLARLNGGASPAVTLAIALCVRAPRYGHICVELDRIREDTIVEPDEDGVVPQPPWPAVDAWLAELGDSTLVRGPVSAERDEGSEPDASATPLVLDGKRLYLDRYWGYQERLAGAIRLRATERPDDVDMDRLSEGLDALFIDDGKHPVCAHLDKAKLGFPIEGIAAAIENRGVHCAIDSLKVEDGVTCRLFLLGNNNTAHAP